jgi:hypothetical protein
MSHSAVNFRTFIVAFVYLLCLQVAPCLKAQPCSEWNLATDFRVFPNQENPNRDSCGNMNVWYFLQSDPATYPAHLPLTYSSLSEFTNDAMSVVGLELWEGGVISTGPKDKLPSVGINNTGSVQTPLGAIAWGPGVVFVHPLFKRSVVVGWRSPIDGAVSVSGGVRDIDNSCGDGISWSIDRYDGSSNTTLASGAFSEGGLQGFQNGIGGVGLGAVTVKKGDFIYVVVDPKSDFNCDSTALTFIVRPVAVEVPVFSRAVLLVLLMGLASIGTLNLRIMSRW